MQDLRITLIQAEQFWEEKEKNLAHFEQLIKYLQPAETDLILLPEMFNTSFTMNAEKHAETMDGEGVNWLITQAKEKKTRVGASLIIADEGKYHNRFVLVNEEGVIAHYDKRHLFRMADEHQHFTAGDRRVIVEIEGWKVLLQVCYDLRFPVFSRNRRVDEKHTEYDAVIYVANWPERRSFIWKNLLQARAIENQAFTVGLNRVGVDGNNITYSGDTRVVDPWGNIQFSLEDKEEHVTTVLLRKAILEEIKERFPAYLDSDSFGAIDGIVQE